MMLPDRWPSAWPSLWRPVRDRAAFAVPAALLTALGLGWLGDLSLTWWVPLLPLLLLAGPLTRPGRVRRSFDRASADGSLTVVDDRAGVLVWGSGRTVAAEVTAGGAIRYLDGVSAP